jgi:hypothetical protein
MYDLVIKYPDGKIAAAEVTAAADEDQMTVWQTIRRRSPWIVPRLAGGWTVRILPSARPKNLLRQLPALLQELEQAGLPIVRGDVTSSDALEESTGRLGVIEAIRAFVAQAGRIVIMPPELPTKVGNSLPITNDPLGPWISQWVPLHPDNLVKDAPPAASEHHLFILLPGLNDAPSEVNYLLIEPGAQLPSTPPVLPPPFTHVWTMSTWDSGDGFRWSPAAGWQRFAKV